MRFLLDKNVSFRADPNSRRTAMTWFTSMNCPWATPPIRILERASREERIIISADTGFGAHLAAGAVVAVRRHDVRVRRLPMR